MGSSDYEYSRLLASSWDFIRDDTSGFSDRQFFRDQILSNGEPALDVGCGTGRLLLEFLAIGLDVDGIDNSPEMLAICAEKAKQSSLAVNLYTQGMEQLDLPRQYQTIFVPSYSFQLVPDLNDAKKSLDTFYEHLLPGGILVLSIWYSKRKGPAEWGDWWIVVEKDGFEDGKTLKRSERSMYDEETQLRHTENRYELIEDGEVVYTEMHRRSPELRNYTLGQITSLLEEAEYSVIHAVSEYSSEPATEDDGVFCIMGKKPEATNTLS
jgi:SAM-dependent methyltransferase